ncbi:hypothetical protein [Dechloromonas sp. HYN0024]|uniref:hypothetical protein n=1 Tax=Dechloromonas sp. HYN0024 TaxID=2231055 RepID=UPI000E43DC84|nr:hypothetical protein [Dechloromonas sp. HYN0024]AXS80278.1 hypothetical protein HYN24_09740 [Dechloromonas sp. HYN0024]
MAYELVWEPEGVINRFSGVVRAWELVQSVETIQGDARFDDTRYVINDFLAVTEYEMGAEILTEVAVLQYGAYNTNPNCRIVFVTTDDALATLVRGVPESSGITSYQTEVCPTVSAARDWLDSQPQLHLMSNVMGFRLN